MSNTTIKTDGRCISKSIRAIEQKIGNKSATQLKQTAIDIVKNCVDVYIKNFGDGDVGATGTGLVSNCYQKEDIPNGTTGLIYGRVQSGKTNTTIATLAIAQENGFRCFIVLTSDNTWLGKQTAARFNNQIKGCPVFDWEQWKNDPQEFAQSKLKPYLKDRSVVLVSTKNVRHLEKLIEVLKYAKVSSVPTLIFDDEADNASLNTNEAKQSKKGKDTVADSAIFDKISQKIRKEVANHIYLQITATPQSLLLQNLGHPCQPVFCAALPEAGDSYMGGDLFFSKNSHYCVTVEATEIDELKQQEGNINPGNNWNIPEGLRLALCCFFLGSIYKMQSKPDQIYSFLAHICYKKDNHNNLEKIISNFILQLDKALREESSQTKQQQALKWLNEAYQELTKTASASLPPLDELIQELKDELPSTISKVQVINANNPDKEPNYNPGMNILIGGNRLGRGVTIEGLMITYYGRDAKQKVMDTVHQHARMYGYREHLKDVTRLFLPQHILEAFRSIYEADEGMRQAIGNDPNNIKIEPVWVGKSLKPTRSCVLNLAAIDSFTPGSHIFPQDPLYKSSETKKNMDKLDQLLQPYNDNDTYYEVEIDFLIEILSYMKSKKVQGDKWEDMRVQQSLKAMKAKGLTKGRLNVPRRKDGKGLDMKRKEPGNWFINGPFCTNKYLTNAKRNYTGVPTLVVAYQKGEKEDNWDDQPLYLPTLILPKSKFVFMFNYSGENENSDNDED